MSEFQTHQSGRVDYTGEKEAIRTILRAEGPWGALDMFAHPSFDTIDRMLIRDATKTALLEDAPRHSILTENRDTEYLLALEYMNEYIDAEISKIQLQQPNHKSKTM